MTDKDFTTETDASLDVTRDVINIQFWDEEAGLTVSIPKRFTENFDTKIRFGVNIDAEDMEGDNYKGTWGHVGFNLSREQAKKLGDFLLDHYDDDPETMFSEDVDEE